MRLHCMSLCGTVTWRPVAAVACGCLCVCTSRAWMSLCVFLPRGSFRPDNLCRPRDCHERERHKIALSCICSLCFLHMHRGSPHACIACADRWFRGALGVPRVPAAASSSGMAAPGYAQLIEGALGALETAEAGAHIAAHVAEALSMHNRPDEAAACLRHSLDALVLLADVPRVRCLRRRCAILFSSSTRHQHLDPSGPPLMYIECGEYSECLPRAYGVRWLQAGVVAGPAMCRRCTTLVASGRCRQLPPVCRIMPITLRRTIQANGVGAAARGHVRSLEQLLRSSLAVAEAHARNLPAAASAAAEVLLQPDSPSSAALPGLNGPRPTVASGVVEAAVEALQSPLRSAGGGAAATDADFARLLRDCGGDPFRAAVCVAADDVVMHGQACGVSGEGGSAEQGRLGEARRAAWEVHVLGGIRSR